MKVNTIRLGWQTPQIYRNQNTTQFLSFLFFFIHIYRCGFGFLFFFFFLLFCYCCLLSFHRFSFICWPVSYYQTPMHYQIMYIRKCVEVFVVGFGLDRYRAIPFIRLRFAVSPIFYTTVENHQESYTTLLATNNAWLLSYCQRHTLYLPVVHNRVRGHRLLPKRETSFDAFTTFR